MSQASEMIYLGSLLFDRKGRIVLNDSWIIENLNNALATWNDKLSEIWMLVSQSPEEFKGGTIWGVVVQIHNALQGVGYGLLILFFAISVFQHTVRLQELRRPETALRLFIRFVATKTVITYGMDLMNTIFSICGGIVQTIASGMGDLTQANATLPEEIQKAVEEVSFLESIPLWLVSFLGSLFILLMSFVLILTVYGRFFKLFLYTALAPIPLSTFAGEVTSHTAKAFLKSYIGVCLEGAVIVLACTIYSAFLSSGTSGLPDVGQSAVAMIWAYMGETIFNMLVLTALVKGADRVVKEMLAL